MATLSAHQLHRTLLALKLTALVPRSVIPVVRPRSPVIVSATVATARRRSTAVFIAAAATVSATAAGVMSAVVVWKDARS
jgi:hypothetical protein